MEEVGRNEVVPTGGRSNPRVGEISKEAWLALSAVSILAGLGAMAADMASGWSATPSRAMETALSLGIEDVASLLSVKSHSSLIWGHYLALVFIPLGILGIWCISILLDRGGRRWSVSFLVLGTLTYVVGTAYHITYGFVATVIQHDNERLIRQIAPFFEPFGIVVIVALILSMIPLVGGILTGRTIYPRWTAALTPVPLLLGLSILAHLFPAPVKNLITVTGINASMTIFVALSVALAIQKDRTGSERSPWALSNTDGRGKQQPCLRSNGAKP